MKPIGKTAVIIDWANRKHLTQQMRDTNAQLGGGEESEEEKAAREERQRQKLYILEQLRDAMSKAYAVLGERDGQAVIHQANWNIRNQRKFEAAQTGSEEF